MNKLSESMIQQNRNNFLNICQTSIKRQGIEKLLNWLDRDTDFFTAPASTRYHGCYAGGLCEHSLDVYRMAHELKYMVRFKKSESEPTDESIAIAALFHDACKANFYTVEFRNRKNDAGQWEKYPVFTVNEKFAYGGHGSKSVYLVQKHIQLLDQEAVAIHCHMGFADAQNSVPSISAAYENCFLAWMIHVADEAATYLLDRKED